MYTIGEKIAFPTAEHPNTIPIASTSNNMIVDLLQHLIRLEQERLNLELTRQFYHEPDPNKVKFKYYSDTQTGIGAGATTPRKIIYPLDSQKPMTVDAVVTHISVYCSSNTIGQTGVYNLYKNNVPEIPFQNIPVNTASSVSLIKLPSPIHIKPAEFLQYQITNTSSTILDYYIVLLGYDDYGYFIRR